MTPKRHNYGIRPKYMPNFVNENLIVFAQCPRKETVTPSRPPARSPAQPVGRTTFFPTNYNTAILAEGKKRYLLIILHGLTSKFSVMVQCDNKRLCKIWRKSEGVERGHWLSWHGMTQLSNISKQCCCCMHSLGRHIPQSDKLQWSLWRIHKLTSETKPIQTTAEQWILYSN